MAKETMTAKSIMVAAKTVLAPDDSLTSAMTKLVRSGERQIAVVDEGALVGIVSEWDLLRANVRKDFARLTVSDVMTGNVHTVDANEPVASLGARMFEERFGCFPVLHKGKLIGLVTTSGVLAWAAQQRKPAVAKQAAPAAKKKTSKR